MINRQLIEAELCKRSFFFFFKHFFDVIIQEPPVFNWHIEYLCQELQEVVFALKKRSKNTGDIIINIPPGTSKSSIVTVMLPVWAWLVDPTLRVMTASYTSTLSASHSMKSKDIINHERFKKMFPDIELRPDFDTKSHYANTRGGERFATSSTGTATGFHANLIIVDDPINPREAVSDVSRASANAFMDTTLSTRKTDKDVTVTVLVMQRLHQFDPTGNWINKPEKNIRHICLPGTVSENVKPPELKERYVDGLLDPKRLSKESLAAMMIDLGAYGYAGQVDQIPSPAGGQVWRKWIKPVPDSEFPRDLESFGTDWDLAYTKDDTNSACAYVCSGKVGTDMYISDLGWDWLEFPEMVAWMKTRPMPHFIEAKASGKSAKQTLTRMGIPAIEVTVRGGDKEARARMATPYAEAGMIYCRASLLEKLYSDTKQGILFFPKTGTDLNDALVQAINRLLAGGFFVV